MLRDGVCTIQYMIQVTRPTLLPTDVLWQVLSDLDRWASWLPTVDAIRPAEPGRPAGIGVGYVLEQPGLPRATWTITDWRPGGGFTWESRAGRVRSTGRHELTPTERGTDVVLSLDWTGPAAGLVRLVYGRKTRRYVEREAQALQDTAQDLTDRT